MTKKLFVPTPADVAFKNGVAAYVNGCSIRSNPYDREHETELFVSWWYGFKHEKNYWEEKL